MDVGMSGYGFCAVKGSSKCQSDVGFSNIPAKASYVLFRVALMLMDSSISAIFMEAWNIEKGVHHSQRECKPSTQSVFCII